MNTEQIKCRRSSDRPPKVLVEPDKPCLLRGFAPSRDTLSLKTKKPHLPAGNEAFRETADSEASVGVEPTRDGFAIRCLSHLATTPE